MRKQEKFVGSKMPAGRYHVGDLCYVLTEEKWEEACELMFPTVDSGRQGRYGTFTLSDGTVFTILPTKYGDGCYPSSRETCFAVDSGTIGCILASSLERSGDFADAGVFDLEDFTPEYDDGTLHFGDVSIYTGDDAEEDDELLEEDESFFHYDEAEDDE